MNARRLIEQDEPDDKDEVLAAAVDRLPAPDEVSYDLTVEPEEGQPDWPRPTDNAEDAMAHDETMDEIAERMENGDPWAWGQVTVTATWTNNDSEVFEGHDYLGGCSYQDEADFKRPGGYYEDMQVRAYEDLIKKMESNLNK